MKRALAERANKTADAMSSSYPPVPLHVAPSSFSDKNSTHSSPFSGSTGKKDVHVDSQSHVNSHNDTNQQNLYSTTIKKRQRSHVHGPQSDSRDLNTTSEIENKRVIDPQQVSSMTSNFRQSSSQTQPVPVSSSLNNSLPQNQSESSPRQRRKRRKEEASSEEDEEEQSSKAYFLKFQNKALASELYMLKHQLQKYQKIEKDWKSTGKEIEKGILTMEQRWRKSVASLCSVLYSIGFLIDRNGEVNLSQKQSHKIDHQDHIDRETPSSLLHSIQRVISGLTTKIPGPDSDAQSSPSHAPQQMSLNNNDIGGNIEEINLENLQNLIDMVNTMSDQAEVVIRDGLSKWMNIIALPRLNGINSSKKDIMNIAQLYQQVSIYQQNIDAFQDKVAELTKEKEDALQAEKRVRRGLYRIAAGRLKIEDVMKDVENEDNGMPPLHDLDVAVKPDPDSNMIAEVVSSSSQNDMDGSKSPMKNDEKSSKASVSAEITQKLQELESVCEVRNNRIQELLNEKENLEKKINKLIAEPGTGQMSTDAGSLTPEIIQQTDTFTDVAAKLATAEETILDLTNSMKDIQERWGVSKGECEHMKKIIDELNEKHAKRWKNLTGNSLDDEKDIPDGTDTTAKEDKNKSNTEGKNNKKVVELTFSKERTLLEHKLQQALEGMRQVEGLRLALAEATKMNDCLQSQVSEWKSKYTTLSSSKSSSRSSSSSQKQSSSTSSSSKSEAAMERIKLDFRKCRKELMAEKLARENYKTKNERLEKERDSMMRTNVRLIKQSSEKEEMNTKSLSSILQLNHLSELHAQQIETLEQKLKAVEQVALAARLASNAKARFEEELKKENKSLEQKIETLNNELSKAKSEKIKAEALLDQSKSQLQASAKDLDIVRKRCDELAEESTATVKEKTKLMESLAVVKKSAQNSLERTNTMGKSYDSNGSSFTVKELNTHLSVLKRRLACQVCNERDKRCILLRCRHMFCKQCVEKNIKNRSRKCPACGQRFDTKDVGDIWL